MYTLDNIISMKLKRAIESGDVKRVKRLARKKGVNALYLVCKHIIAKDTYSHFYAKVINREMAIEVMMLLVDTPQRDVNGDHFFFKLFKKKLNHLEENPTLYGYAINNYVSDLLYEILGVHSLGMKLELYECEWQELLSEMFCIYSFFALDTNIDELRMSMNNESWLYSEKKLGQILRLFTEMGMPQTYTKELVSHAKHSTSLLRYLLQDYKIHHKLVKQWQELLKSGNMIYRENMGRNLFSCHIQTLLVLMKEGQVTMMEILYRADYNPKYVKQMLHMLRCTGWQIDCVSLAYLCEQYKLHKRSNTLIIIKYLLRHHKCFWGLHWSDVHQFINNCTLSSKVRKLMPKLMKEVEINCQHQLYKPEGDCYGDVREHWYSMMS